MFFYTEQEKITDRFEYTRINTIDESNKKEKENG